jgi:hypothetical protein
VEHRGVDFRFYRLDADGRIASGGNDVALAGDTETLDHAQQMAQHCPSVAVCEVDPVSRTVG